MSQTDLLDLAKKGDIDAISTIINRNLNPKGITAKVSKNGSCLRILLETQTPPIQSNLVNYIHKGIGKLAIYQIEILQIFGRQIGDDIPAWSQSINLYEEVLQPPDIHQQPMQDSSQTQRSEINTIDSLFTTPKYEKISLVSRITLIIFGSIGMISGLVFLAIPVLGWILGGMTIFGSIVMLAAGISGTGMLKGRCPYCGEDVSISESQKGVNCSICTKRIIIRDRKFYRIE
ncbi:hypothetical protein [Prochlorothrix hollandica]|uniref:hypothetical protein n=1 Tax=Prochlorothrix hollandica TaxID=1223 RepID=UPI00036C563B|nr:hypothetical protein [Prochlorothrix hollandica]